MFGRPRDRPLAGPPGAGVDWSQEEADVQRILSNLRNNAPELPPVANPRGHIERFILERDLGMFGGPPPREQAEAAAAVNKKGLIQ